MSDSLTSYLTDHVGGAQTAVSLLQFLRDHYAGESTGRLAEDLLGEIEKDKDVLEDLLERAGATKLGRLKEAFGWIGEKISRLKTHHLAGNRVGELMALEALGLGIQGKLALWRSLKLAADSDDRLIGLNFDQLAARAQEQYEAVEAQRMRVARLIFESGGE